MSRPAHHLVGQADIDACAREPIHVPGLIQPHGTLLVLSPDDLTVLQAAENAAALLGLPSDSLIGRPLRQVLRGQGVELPVGLSDLAGVQSSHFIGAITVGQGAAARRVDAVAYRAPGDVIVLEFETVATGFTDFESVFPLLRGFVDRLQHATTIDELGHLVAMDVRRITGFDRALLYRFDPDWHGVVVSEDGNGELPSYLGHHFPASDIPAQARDLYRRNRLRIIPDVDYTPVRINPSANPRTGAPLDLSLSILRSVSPVHLEYMRNMGTAASLSISVMREGELWGLISCHNRRPCQASLQVRNACDFLAHIFSLQVAARERADEAEHHARLAASRTRLLGYTAEEQRFLDGLTKHPDELLALPDAQGAAVLAGEQCVLFGTTPSEAEVMRLAAFLTSRGNTDVFATEALCRVFPEAEAYARKASGVLAISISKIHSGFILWFRPEQVRTITWGGNPDKPLDALDRLHPRNSFDAWRQEVKGQAAPWRASEIEAVKELRSALVGVVLRRAEEMASLTEQLQRSNKELEAFSYSVSHDLRAPFRHIVGYAELLRQREGEGLSENGRRYIDTIIESAYSAGTLVDSLLAFSQMGRKALHPRMCDMNALVVDVRDRLYEPEDRRIVWKVAALPPAYVDPQMFRLVLENLLSNAVKYTRGRDPAVIEIGAVDVDGSPDYYVRDNGAGFEMAYVNKLFGVFQRLHRTDEFEGTGIGLANVKRIVERHGGRVWAEGAVDAGATFHFTLPEPPTPEES